MKFTTAEVISFEAHQKYLESFKIPSQYHQIALAKWSVYFGNDLLESLQELCEDVGVTGDISSKRKCKLVCHSSLQ